MPAMDTLLFNDPEVKGLAFAILEECTDLQAFGRRMLELLANAAMSAKADEACNAPYGERDEGRVNSRNGYRERGLSTAAGDVTLKIPKLRRGSFFPEDLIERYCRVDRALVAAVAEMYVMGISTRKVEAVAGELGVRSMSKSQVSRLCECLDAEVDAFRRQRFDGVRFAYLWLDATYVKCRVEGRSASQAVVTAIGLDDTGHKRFVGVDCVDTESHAGWKAFLSGLRARGVDGVRLVVSDAHEGLAKAIAETFQGAAWQRCVTHLMRNVAGRIHRKDDPRGDRGGAEDLEGGRKRALGGRGGGARLPGVPGHAPHQDPHQQRPGEGQPRDQAQDARRAGVPLARVAHPPGGSGAHRGRRGVVGALRHLQALARARLEGPGARGPRRGRGARRPRGGAQDHRERH